ncbi:MULTISPECIES: hypothetical protein [Streptomyces]|uniref:hypothetical protein n=1 Tax=Streptomyces TaxID=1883 RepID=UPI00167929EE|nr:MULTISPECIES: hypothetical protein [Streptomyces]MCZ4513020.1 hypothetical protein [Streptomyces sp. ActVer]GHB32086.1 hypothetical protein GCM10010306_026590 [Streptomyces umbrinus]
MTSDNPTSAQVQLRTDGDVDRETLAYARQKIDAVLNRPGLPAVTGEVRITRATAHHGERPWSAAADVRVGGRQVVVLAEEATGHEVVDQLQGRLRRQTDKAAHTWAVGRKPVAPPWRGGATGPESDASHGSHPA